ncbi:hypothetical protein DPMN_194682 [Dreissena polymorpha]|uniref:Uncharacterized protein n=1 Tax=Dreissena polymorpha TaxID=45954 RepID=A0A9D3XZV4_DREPO|nr:hypothetical protein DPMN_194682 [Dreissena polymorpha]
MYQFQRRFHLDISLVYFLQHCFDDQLIAEDPLKKALFKVISGTSQTRWLSGHNSQDDFHRQKKTCPV